FSSRRRHTRSKRDWSSDVCSSDLHIVQLPIYHDPIMSFLSPFFRNIHFNQWMVLTGLHFVFSVIVELVDCTSGSSFLVFCIYQSGGASLQLFVSRFFRL